MTESRKQAAQRFANDSREQPDPKNRVARGNENENGTGRGRGARAAITRRTSGPAAQRRH
jgi:hypothetical protein